MMSCLSTRVEELRSKNFALTPTGLSMRVEATLQVPRRRAVIGPLSHPQDHIHVRVGARDHVRARERGAEQRDRK